MKVLLFAVQQQRWWVCTWCSICSFLSSWCIQLYLVSVKPIDHTWGTSPSLCLSSGFTFCLEAKEWSSERHERRVRVRVKGWRRGSMAEWPEQAQNHDSCDGFFCCSLAYFRLHPSNATFLTWTNLVIDGSNPETNLVRKPAHTGKKPKQLYGQRLMLHIFILVSLCETCCILSLSLSGPAGADSDWWRQLPNWVWEKAGERPGHQGACTHQAVQVDTEPCLPEQPSSHAHGKHSALCP